MNKIIFEKYQIDDSGIIFNLKSNKTVSPIYNQTFNLLKLNLQVNNKKTSFYLHKLIAMAFIPGYNETTDKISFIDKNPKNCKLDNLEVYRYVKIYPLEK
jgi:hypothetical protein